MRRAFSSFHAPERQKIGERVKHLRSKSQAGIHNIAERHTLSGTGRPRAAYTRTHFGGEVRCPLMPKNVCRRWRSSLAKRPRKARALLLENQGMEATKVSTSTKVTGQWIASLRPSTIRTLRRPVRFIAQRRPLAGRHPHLFPVLSRACHAAGCLARFNLTQMLMEPDLETVDVDVHLVATLLTLSKVIPKKRRTQRARSSAKSSTSWNASSRTRC